MFQNKDLRAIDAHRDDMGSGMLSAVAEFWASLRRHGVEEQKIQDAAAEVVKTINASYQKLVEVSPGGEPSVGTYTMQMMAPAFAATADHAELRKNFGIDG